METIINKVKQELHKNGILLLNSTPEMPNIIDLGGDWDLAMYLIEEREVFVSKLYKGRTTYLSRDMYYMLKEKIQNYELNEDEERVFNFIETNDNVDTRILKLTLGYESKELNKILIKLQKELMITVLKRGETLSKSWSTYFWGTYNQWEKRDENPIKPKFDQKLVFSKLRNIIRDKDIERMIRL